LIQEGLRSGFLYPLVEKQDGNGGSITLPLDACNLSELCEMAKHFTSLNEMELQTLQLPEDDMPITELDLSSQVIENSSSFSKMITLMGQKYLLPPKSSFLLSDISCMQPLLNCSKTFDVIVIDPPWENKSVKRSNRYNWLSPQQIKQMPVPKLAAADCLVVTWVTNRQKHLCFVKEELYPSVTYCSREDTNCSRCVRITEVLKDYIKPGGQCLELFARNLQPGWMSWGNEVLKFQHVDYFIALESGR
ncbi:hypothetical protein A6R68_23599, partial [Neotoma lepida]